LDFDADQASAGKSDMPNPHRHQENATDFNAFSHGKLLNQKGKG
jgi:hypothetical protein